ncbi:MAG: hypothetical protein AABZ00_16760 [Chloroflexota bacterium]|jgi:hypothetical protein
MQLCIGQITVEQKPFTTEPRSFALIFLSYSGTRQCLRYSVVQKIFSLFLTNTLLPQKREKVSSDVERDWQWDFSANRKTKSWPSRGRQLFTYSLTLRSNGMSLRGRSCSLSEAIS